MSYKKFGFVLGPLLFILIHFFFKDEALSEQGRDVLAAITWIGVWWVFEVLPIAATALLPIVLFPLLDAVALGDTTASYGHKYVFLFLGGFILAAAIEKWNLHKRIALQIIKTIGTNMYTIVLGFMVATAFLSMWISNTATTVMVLPMAISIVKQLKDNPETPEDENKVFSKLLMLAIAICLIDRRNCNLDRNTPQFGICRICPKNIRGGYYLLAVDEIWASRIIHTFGIGMAVPDQDSLSP